MATNLNSRTPSHQKTAAASTNITVVRTSRAQLLYAILTNGSAATKYVKLYDKGTTPVLASDVPIAKIAVPAGGTVLLNPAEAISFANGFSYALTGAAADTDTTALAAGDVSVTFWFR